jgi:hypothetical protein
MEEKGNFFAGLLWGTTLSVPLWIAFLGWIKIVIGFFYN